MYASDATQNNIFTSLKGFLFGYSFSTLGLEVKNSNGGGVELIGVRSGSIADKAGLKSHISDVITHVCYQEVATQEEALAVMKRKAQVHFWLERPSNAKDATHVNKEVQHRVQKVIGITPLLHKMQNT